VGFFDLGPLFSPMSGFDEEAERERLREKYERDQEKRASTQRMSELLLKGATMTNSHCDACGDPIFRYDGQEFCPTCQAAGEEAAERDAEGDADADAETTASGAATEGADAETAASVRAEAERLTTARETAETWDRAAHAEAFGETPARVGYALAADGVRATGEYRDRPVLRDPVELVAGETLALDVAVANTGGAAGEYDLALTVDGETADSRSGSVAAGDAGTETLEHAFAEPGEYAVRVAGERLSVVVSEPAPPSVRGVSTDADRVTAGDSVRVTATVANDAGLPAGGDLAFRVDGETVAAAPVRLDSGGETTVARPVTLGEPAGSGGTNGGDREVTVSVAGPADEASTTVTVGGDGPVGGATDDGAPGLGPVVAVIALIAAAGLLGRRDHEP